MRADVLRSNKILERGHDVWSSHGAPQFLDWIAAPISKNPWSWQRDVQGLV
jgi:hypothetical protein